jgi:hypothetical protein
MNILMNSSELKILEYYIARNSENKEQIVYYDGIDVNKKQTKSYFSGYYVVYLNTFINLCKNFN